MINGDSTAKSSVNGLPVNANIAPDSTSGDNAAINGSARRSGGFGLAGNWNCVTRGGGNRRGGRL